VGIYRSPAAVIHKLFSRPLRYLVDITNGLFVHYYSLFSSVLLLLFIGQYGHSKKLLWISKNFSVRDLSLTWSKCGKLGQLNQKTGSSSYAHCPWTVLL